MAHNYDNVHITKGVDEIKIITQWPIPDHRTKIELPFNGYVWLALALFWTAKSRKLIKILIVYQVIWAILLPLVFLLILNGNGFMLIAANLHEKVYKALFIIVGLLAVSSATLSLNRN